MRIAAIHVFGGSRHSLIQRAGGVETFLKNLLEHSDKHNVLLLIIGKKNRVFPEIITKSELVKKSSNNARTKQTMFFPYFGYLLSNLAFSLISSWTIFMLVNRLKKKYSIILHVHDPTFGASLFLLSSKLFPSVTLVSQFHSEYTKRLKVMLPKCRLSSFTICLYSTLERICILKSNLIVAVSSSIRRYLLRLGCAPNKIKKLPIFLDIVHLQKNVTKGEELRKKFGISKSDFIFVYVGRLSAEKNLETLISAFLSINYNDLLKENIKLLIVGGGEHLPKLAMSDHCTLSKVLCLGHRNDIVDILHSSDLFVLPSFTEGFPFSLLEAMACGKAIIASDMPAIREIVEDGKEALLFDPHSSEQLKNAMLTLYNNPKLRKKLGENAKKKARQYDVGVVFPKILQTYQEVLKKQYINEKGI